MNRRGCAATPPAQFGDNQTTIGYARFKNRQRASMRIPVLVLLFVGSCLGCDDVASLVEKVHGLLKSGAKSPEDVNLGLKIKKLSFSEDYNSLKLDALLTYRWEDSKFAFAQDNFCDKYLTVDPSSVAVMLPKLFFENTRKTQFFNETIQQVLHENGTFALNERMEVTLPCEQTNIFYPFGVTRCSLITRKAKSPSTQNTQIYWINDIAAEQNFAERNIRTEGMLRLKHVEFKEETEEHQDDTEDGILTLIMDFSQNNNKLFFTFFFPSILIVTISWLSMILGPMAITRSLMILGSFVILFLHYNSHEVFSVRVNYITPLDVWKVVTFLFVIAAFMELVIVSCMASTGRSRRLTRCCRQRKVHSKNTYTVEPLYEELNDLRSRATRTTCSCCRYSALCMDVAWLAGYAVAFAFFVFIFFTRYKDIVRWLNNVDVSDVTDLSSS
ncbi:hypothetical protein L596_003653 [Steinernema carpocapsae]|uniref:Neurotransmitter-gated ion-channel ligand-binding domain-containing protein n=1 Tax=Steinernema carpocapsae TaxID=34508 RepID=A0A4U8UTA5_STECR|nr:hypothetical protein L596_003653 [Steinernema carpocapsae]